MELVRAASGLFPDVLLAVEQLRETNSNRETRTFARRVANEKIIYDQFARRLALLSPLPSVSQGLMVDVEEKIGPDGVQELRRDLELMNDFLRGLKADLFNASRGTEVLAKLGRKTSPLKGPAASSPLQKSLSDVSQANKRLSAYLLQPLVSLPTERDLKSPLEVKILVEAPTTPSTRFVKVVPDRFACFSCPNTILGTSTPSTEDAQYSRNGTNTTIVQEDFENLRILMEQLLLQTNEHGHGPDHQSSLLSKNLQTAQTYFGARNGPEVQKKHRILISASPAEATIDAIDLDHLIEKFGRVLEPSERAELAFHVALLTLLVLFKVSPFNDLEEVDFDILSDLSRPNGPYSLLLHMPNHQATMRTGRNTSDKEVLSVLTESTALARLGVRLTQIMFGRTMAEIRMGDPNLPVANEGLDEQVQDILTARQLLTTRRVRNKLGREFEAIINVCLNQQYRERKLARVVRLDRHDPSFPEHATSLILLPLFQELRKAIGCFCESFLNDDHVLNNEGDQIMDPPAEKKNHSSSGDAERSPWQVLETGFSRSSDDAPAKDKTPTMSHHNGMPHSDSQGSVVKAADLDAASHPRGLGGDQTATNREPGDHGPSLVRYQGETGRKRIPSGGNTRGPKSPEPPEEHTTLAAPALQKSPGLIPSRVNEIGTRLAPESVQSYDDATSGTTESWFDWFSDKTEELPILAPSHPLSSLTPHAIAILLSHYNKWRACAMEQEQEQEQGPPSAPPPNGLSPTHNRRKRPKFSHAGRDDDEDNGDDDGGRSPDPNSTRKKQSLNESTVTFSCPFLKKDSTKHGECSKYMLSRIRDVKQHLGRKHQMPIYCPRCIETFSDEDSRDEHNRNVDCERSQLGKPEGITEAQKKALGKKAPANQSQEEQWYGIFDILFPNHPRPASPYIDSALLRNAFVYQSFLASNGPRILSSILESSGAMSWNPPPFPQSDVQLWREQVLAQAFQQLFDRWATMGALANSNTTTDTPFNTSAATGAVGTSSAHMNLPLQHSIETESNSAIGDDLYRFDVITSETASSVSEILSWQSESDFLTGNAQGGVVPSPFGPMGTAHYNGSITFTPYDTQELQQTFSRGLDFYSNGNGNDNNTNNNGNNSGHHNNNNGHNGRQHNMHYGH